MKNYIFYYAFALLISIPTVVKSSDSESSDLDDHYPDPTWQLYTHKDLKEQGDAYARLKDIRGRINDCPKIQAAKKNITDQAELQRFNKEIQAAESLWMRIALPDPDDEATPQELTRRLMKSLPKKAQEQFNK